MHQATMLKMINSSSIASVLMTLYLSATLWNLYQMMYPLARVDLSQYKFPHDYVHPLWKTKASDLHLRVYLSPQPLINRNSLAWSHIASPEEHGVVLLWDERLDQRPSLTKSFLLTKDSVNKDRDESYQHAKDWLDRADRSALIEITGEGGLLSSLAAASGQGIESTSFLLTLYQSFARQVRSALETMSLVEPRTSEGSAREQLGLLESSTVELPSNAPVWKALQTNATVFVNVFLVRANEILWPPHQNNETGKLLSKAGKTQNLLTGQVDLIKYEPPHHIEKPRRILYHDITYFLRHYLLGDRTTAAPWSMHVTQPEASQAYSMAQSMQQNGQGYPYWKPEVSIKLVSEDLSYPVQFAHSSGMPIVKLSKQEQHPQGYAFLPALHVDEMGMTSEKYVPVNETITSLPLRISFDRSDLEGRTTTTTASGGGMSPARWRLLSHMAEAIEKQKDIGFEQSDIDDIKRLIADTNVTLLAITMLASTLHLLFEFLTFQNEVSFWNSNKDLTGLSVRSLFLDMMGQTVILFFLIEKESSLLMTIPSAIGCLIALWKCQKAAGLKYTKVKDPSSPCPWWDWLPRTVAGYELRATRLEAASAQQDPSTKQTKASKAKQRLVAMTIESDRLATRYLGVLLLPLTLVYTLYSLVYQEHRGWYSWLITSLATAVYALGFVLMTPQLFLNWKLKSVSHLPWKVLVFKTLSTFIDDLFSCTCSALLQ